MDKVAGKLSRAQQQEAEKAWASAEHFYSQATCDDIRDSIQASYLAALKAAGALVASTPKITRTRPLTRDVWVLLARISDDWDEDIAYFRHWDGIRRDAEMGLTVAITKEQATSFFHKVGEFMDRVAQIAPNVAA
ncbi:MAG: SAV_6107 family HEPN domain-containing protein [Lawsonella sp.]